MHDQCLLKLWNFYAAASQIYGNNRAFVCDQWGEKAFPTNSFYHHFLEYFAKLCFHKQRRSWALLNLIEERIWGRKYHLIVILRISRNANYVAKFSTGWILHSRKCSDDGLHCSLKRIFLSFLNEIYDPEQNMCNA